MKQYKCVKIGYESEDTQLMLNELAQKGWKVICSYSKNGYWLILESEKEICSKCLR